MPRVLVVDHHDSYTFNLVHLVGAVTGELPDVIQHDDADAARRWRADYSHLVLSPGPGTVTEVGDFAVGREIVAEAEVPVFGVCLGMQGMVSVLGGTVATVRPAHGELDRISHVGTGLFAGLGQGFSVVRYHSLAAVDVPPDLEVTAWCDDDGGRVVMGVAHRERPLHGVQFHPESILSEYGVELMTNFIGLEES